MCANKKVEDFRSEKFQSLSILVACTDQKELAAWALLVTADPLYFTDKRLVAYSASESRREILAYFSGTQGSAVSWVGWDAVLKLEGGVSQENYIAVKNAQCSVQQFLENNRYWL